MESDQSRYMWVGFAEDPNDYTVGGYHPLNIGDRLHRRYRIVHKLGHGTYSTVWMAVDEDQPKRKYVALKLAWEACALPLDQFKVTGTYGGHQCIVLPLARCSLGDARASAGCFQLPVSRSLAAQLAFAVAHIHSLGVVHGDLNANNILLRLPHAIDTTTEEELYTMYGRPRPEPIKRCDKEPADTSPYRPLCLFTPIDLRKPNHELLLAETTLMLSDFGGAFLPEQSLERDFITPDNIRAPESHFGLPNGFPSDIWALASMMWACMGTAPFLGDLVMDMDDAIDMYLQALGPMPDSWWNAWKAVIKTRDYTTNGMPKETADQGIETLESRFERNTQWPRGAGNTELVSEAETKAFLEMITKMMVWEPEQRPTAKQVLEMKWMKEWGIPAAEKSLGRKLLV